MTELLNNLPGYEASRLTFHLMAQQAQTGIQFDQEGATALLEKCIAELEDIRQDVEPRLPPRPLKKGEEKEYTMPVKPFKQDGTLSAGMERWMEKHGLELIGVDHIQWEGALIRIEGGKLLPATAPMVLDEESAPLKDWLVSLGWSPSMWNYKKGPNKKPIRDDKGELIKTSPKMSENSQICPNLLLIEGDYEEMVRGIVRSLSLKHRRGMLAGFLKNNRLPIDSRLSGGSAGITNTHRQRGSVVVNLPKAEDGVIYGKEIRGSFVARPGYVLVGWDASALEARVEGHYCAAFDPEWMHSPRAHTLLHGCPHVALARLAFPKQLAFADGLPELEVKGLKEAKRYRAKGKSGNYAINYGASEAKFAKTLGLDPQEGHEIYTAFWEMNWQLKKFKEVLIRFWETTGQKKWMRGIDGRRIYTRSKHSLVNNLFQSCGAIAMDYSAIFMNKWLGGIKLDLDGLPGYLYKGKFVYRVGYQHDEYVYEAPEESAPEIGEMGVKSIRKAGEFLKLRVPLEGEYKVGRSWADIH